MSRRILSVIESPRHPNAARLYEQLGFQHEAVTSIRKALKAVKKAPPDILVAEFIYGYGNNYAGVNISNLDVLLVAINQHARHAKVILFANKAESQHLEKLSTIFPVHAILHLPADLQALAETIREID